MALEQITFNLGALDDSANSGKNYVASKVFEVFNIDDTYADIFADSAGTIPIDQSGIQNISNSDGECKFFIDKGFYNIKSGGKTRQLNANFSFEFETVSDAINARFISLLEGRRVFIVERGAYFDVVLTSTVTPDSLDVIGSISNHLYSFREGKLNLKTINLNENVSVDSTFTLNSNLTNSSAVITGVKTLTTNASNIGRLDDFISLSSANFSVGDLVVVEGVIGHENYTPSRFVDLSFVSEVIGVNGLDIKLADKLDYIVTGVTVSKIPKIDVFINSDLHSSSLSFQYVRSVKFNGRLYGSVGTTGGASFISCRDVNLIDLNVNAVKAEAALCVVAENISNTQVKLTSSNSGGDDGSKVFRANAIQNGTVKATYNSSRSIDSTIYAARGVEFNCKSISGGQNLFDSGSVAGNRLESMQYSECDNGAIKGFAKGSNDQCLELLACTNMDVYGIYENSTDTPSTEGAVVIKGKSVDVRFHGKAIGHQSRGLKIECVDECEDIKTTPECEIVSTSQEAIAVRDASAPYSTNHNLKGKFKGVGTVVTISANSDDINFDGEIDMEFATGTGLSIANSGTIFSIKGINTSANKKLASIGSSSTGFKPCNISGDTDDVNITYNGSSVDLFQFNHLNGLNGRAEFGGVSQYFVMKGGEVYTNNAPTNGIFAAGDSYKRESWNTPAGDESLFGGTYRRAEEGRTFNGTEWKIKYTLFEIT